MAGIASFGAYVPRLRLQRAAVAGAAGWFNGNLRSLGKGERAIAGWDEDSVTMAVEAARDCLIDTDRARVCRIALASTSHPFADRQNAGIVKEALNLRDDIGSADFAGSQRAGTSALLQTLESAIAGVGDVLCIASERRAAKPASEAEMTYGDAAAAFLVTDDHPVAEFLGSHSVTIDFVDHFRASGAVYDYAWESRWVRDEGFGKIAPEAVRAALRKLGLYASDIDHFVMGGPMRGANALVAQKAGLAARTVVDPLGDRMGDAGCAQPLVLLAHALAQAKPGERIMLVGFGQGCDVLVFRATDLIGQPSQRLCVDGWLARRAAETNYVKHLYFGGALNLDGGMRSEADQKAALTTLYRNRKSVLGLVGGRCTETGTVQFPKSNISVAPNRRAVSPQEDYPLADRPGHVVTYTADHLAFTPDPPGYYGMIEFEGGGRLMAEFADVDAEAMRVGQPVRMMFRIKSADATRGFKRYFWKAAPDYRAAPSA